MELYLCLQPLIAASFCILNSMYFQIELSSHDSILHKYDRQICNLRIHSPLQLIKVTDVSFITSPAVKYKTNISIYRNILINMHTFFIDSSIYINRKWCQYTLIYIFLLILNILCSSYYRVYNVAKIKHF